MRTNFHVGCLVAAIALAAGGAWGQVTASTSPPMSWAQALEAAWQRAQERAEAANQLQRAEADRMAAGSPWAGQPAIQLDHRAGRRTGGGSLSESEVGVSAPVWLPGQRQSRAGAAEAGIHAAQRAIEAARLRLAGELRQSALAVSAQEAETRQADLEFRLAKTLAEDVERRVRAGDLARADALAANAEMLQAQANQQAAALRLQQARDRWQLLTGLLPVPSVPTEVADASTGEHPELAAATARVERARRRLELAERTRREPPEIGVRMRRDTDDTGSATSLGVSLSVPFGADRLSAPLLAQARGELDVALAEEERVRDRIALESQSARLQVQGARQQLEAERSRATLLRQRAELIDRSFRAGDTALPELLRALAAAYQADAAVLRQQAALAQAQARLSQSLGLLP